MESNRTETEPGPLLAAVARPIQAFFRLEAASGIALLVAAVAALAWANLGGAESYRQVFDHPITLGLGEASVRFTVHQLVNEGLMAVFFFVVGMEIKRELALGELRTPARAALPAVAALGGMAVPAGLFLAFNLGGPGQAGWGIPMATDIAFCIGVLTLLRRRVSRGLVVFVTALAIFDDIGGILVIALFYGHGLDARWLAAAAAVGVLLAWMSRRQAGSGLAYGMAGTLLWLALHQGGIHATLAGVALGLAVPARPRRHPSDTLEHLDSDAARLRGAPPGEEPDRHAVARVHRRLEELEAPLTRFLHRLHPLVAFGIMPIFALANSGVVVLGLDASRLLGPVAVGTAVALPVGKTVGIFAFTVAAVKAGLAPMPGRASLVKLLGASTVAGIGFTVALFIAGLAYPARPDLLDQAKVGILAGSLAAGIAGSLVLRAMPVAGGQRS